MGYLSPKPNLHMSLHSSRHSPTSTATVSSVQLLESVSNESRGLPFRRAKVQALVAPVPSVTELDWQLEQTAVHRRQTLLAPRLLHRNVRLRRQIRDFD